MSAVDPFPSTSPSLISGLENDFDVTPDDDNDLPFITRGLWVGVGGDIELILKGSETAKIYKNVADGTFLPFRVKRVLASNTAATDILGLY